jgi:hypothetical protein
MFSSSKPDVSAVISRLEAKRDVDDQKSRDMFERAQEAARQGRKTQVRAFLAQKKTHDAASEQYSALIGTLVQQQAVADIAAAHSEIAGVLRGMKGGKLSTANIDHAADVADMVAAAQSDLGGIGGVMFQGDDDLEQMVAALMDQPTEAAAPAPAETAPVEDPLAGLPVPPSSPPTAELDVESLPAVFADMMRAPSEPVEGSQPRTRPGSKFNFSL